MIGSRLATLHELDTVYGVEDLYDLIEVVMVDADNSRAAQDNGNNH